MVTAHDTGTSTIIVRSEDGGYTDKSIITVSTLTGVNQYVINLHTHTLSSCEGAMVEIYSTIGQLISKNIVADNEYKLDMNGLSNGIYIVRIIYKGSLYCSTLLKY